MKYAMTDEEFLVLQRKTLDHIARIGNENLRFKFEQFTDEQKFIACTALMRHKQQCEKLRISVSFKAIKETIDMVTKNQTLCALEDTEYSLPPGIQSANLQSIPVIDGSRIKHADFKSLTARSRQVSNLAPGNFYI